MLNAYSEFLHGNIVQRVSCHVEMDCERMFLKFPERHRHNDPTDTKREHGMPRVYLPLDSHETAGLNQRRGILLGDAARGAVNEV